MVSLVHCVGARRGAPRFSLFSIFRGHRFSIFFLSDFGVRRDSDQSEVPNDRFPRSRCVVRAPKTDFRRFRRNLPKSSKLWLSLGLVKSGISLRGSG